MSKNEKETETKDVHKKKQITPPKSTAREYLESFVVTLVMAIFGMTFILQAVTVPTGSMQNTILIGDYLLVNKFIFAPGGRPIPFFPQREIQQGDIIVFKYPGFRDGKTKERVPPYFTNYVKRVIGMPGDEVEFRNNEVYVNGKLLLEHRIVGDSDSEHAALTTKEVEPQQPNQKYSVYYSENTMNRVIEGKNIIVDPRWKYGVPGKITKVPENQYFVMGDSRDNSEDGRFWGFVDRDLIIGRAMFVYWSCDSGTSDGSLFSCITHPRLDRIGKMIK